MELRRGGGGGFREAVRWGGAHMVVFSLEGSDCAHVDLCSSSKPKEN